MSLADAWEHNATDWIAWGAGAACDSGAAGAARFAVSLPHLTSRRYEDRFDRDGLSITLASMHRPLSAYTTVLFRAGLVITGLRERGDRDVRGC